MQTVCEQFAKKRWNFMNSSRTKNLNFTNSCEQGILDFTNSLNYDIFFRVKLKATVTLPCISFVAEIKENNKPCTHAHDDDNIKNKSTN